MLGLAQVIGHSTDILHMRAAARRSLDADVEVSYSTSMGLVDEAR